MLDSFVVCDLETTGLSPCRNEIIEVGLVLVEGGRIKNTFHTLVRPQNRLPVGIRRLTGLKDEDFRDSPEIKEVLPRILNFLADHPLVGHNVSFDRSFLEAAAGKLSNPAYDTLELAKIIFPFSPGYRLGSLGKYLGIANAGEHRALSDALATVTLYDRLMAGLKELDANLLISLCFFLLRAGSSWAGPLLSLASRPVPETGPEPLFFIPAGEISGECPAPERMVPDLSLAEVTRMLAPGGMVAAAMDDYEYRPQQVEMVKAVLRALEENKHLLMEAGTGTGKSLAYLLPLVCQVLAGGERAVVATHTLNLQSQLWEKDIPALQRMLPWPFTVALLKGRQNYLCLRRWQDILTAGNWSPEEAAFWARILIWAAKTKTGDRAELNLSGREHDFWALVSAESESCPGHFCAWYAKGCFVTRVRREAEKADIVITNHSLVLADLRAENRLLPPYGPLVVDEAHHLEDVATEQLGKKVTWAEVRRWLNVIAKLPARCAGLVPPADFSRWRELLKNFQEGREKLLAEAGLFFRELAGLVTGRLKVQGRQEQGVAALRIRGEGGGRPPFLQAEFASFLSAFDLFLSDLQKLTATLEEWARLDSAWRKHYGEALAQLTAGKDLRFRLAFIFGADEEGHVFWVEVEPKEAGRPAVTLNAAPVCVGGELARYLWTQKKTVVLTSATLSAGGDFGYVMERLGLDFLPPERIITLQVDSPFRYDQQSVLCVVEDVPVQGEVPEEVYHEALSAALTGLIEAAQGKTLVLFTSRRSLQEAYWRLREYCEANDIYLLAHNVTGDRSRLLEEFKNEKRAVLLGAQSFWEGVDIPGEALTCVVIVKLPFGVPGMPVAEARLEDLAKRGRDGFYHYTLPQAVLRFKQGFGRLIRTGRDRGAVVLLDRRILSRSYGKHFLNSLPLTRHFCGSSPAISKYIARWLQD